MNFPLSDAIHDNIGGGGGAGSFVVTLQISMKALSFEEKYIQLVDCRPVVGRDASSTASTVFIQ